MSFWEFIWVIFVTYLFIAYFVVLFHVIGDIFRDPDNGGFAKAMWMLALIFLPFITLLVYLIAKGSGMARRSEEQARAMAASQAAYIREVAATAPGPRTATPAEQIAQAKSLLDSGAITSAEFESLKSTALAKAPVLS
jgi:hypothetical protein